MLRRSILVSCFVAYWLLLFNYESLRAHYLQPLTSRPLPKQALLFPPAGWIMFYQVDPSYGFAEVHGLRSGQSEPIDPHRIFETRNIGYDNIHRNVLVGVLSRSRKPRFCAYLRRKFPEYDGFDVLYGLYPDVVRLPDEVRYQTAYQCR